MKSFTMLSINVKGHKILSDFPEAITIDRQ